jgi:hypothetical protein
MGGDHRAEFLPLETQGFHILQNGRKTLPGSGINQNKIPEIH